eukprot:COSAG01_NODE_7693_length_3096_cov_10.868869_3_plen_147_part_00
MHPKAAPGENNVQGVFDSITDLEKLFAQSQHRLQQLQLQQKAPPGTHGGGGGGGGGGSSYMLETSSLSKLSQLFASLLAHPLQRPSLPAVPVSLQPAAHDTARGLGGGGGGVATNLGPHDVGAPLLAIAPAVVHAPAPIAPDPHSE